MQYRQGKEKRRNLPNWLCFTARRSKDSSTQQLHDVMVSRQSSHSMTSCPPADRRSICGLYFWWFRRDSLRVTPQASSTIRKISCNANQLNVQPECLMFCKDVCTLYHSTLRRPISRNVTLFACTLYHSTLRWAISRNATQFVCTLYHSTLRWAISRYATPFVCTLYHLRLRWAISRNGTLFLCTLYHSTLR